MLELKSKEDKDLIFYIPSLKLYGNARTHEKAKEELDQVVEKYLRKLFKLSIPKIALELNQLGWKQNKYKTKNFSNSYIDKDGLLQDFDIPIENRIIQRKTELFAI